LILEGVIETVVNEDLKRKVVIVGGEEKRKSWNHMTQYSKIFIILYWNIYSSVE